MGRISKVSKELGLQCPNPKCRSREIWQIGAVPTREGRKVRFKCAQCATSFYADAPGAKVRVSRAKVKGKQAKSVGT